MSCTGCGPGGRALDWGSRGRKFESCHSDTRKAAWNHLFLRFYAVFFLVFFTLYHVTKDHHVAVNGLI